MKRNIEVLPDLGVVAEALTVPFPLREYQNRLNKIRREMEARGIDLLYLTSPESMYYVSGLNMVWYTANSSSQWDGNKNTGIAVHVDHDKFILFQMADEDTLVMASTCASDARIKAETDENILCGKTYEGAVAGQMDIHDLIIKDLKEEGWLSGTVGLELGCYRPSPRVSMVFQEKLKNEGCKVTDGTEIVAKIRSIKSPMELNYTRKAAAIADIGHKAIVDEAGPGMTELDIVGIYTRAMMAAGGESMGIVEMVRSGRGKIWSGHPAAGRKKIMAGEPIAVDFSGVYNRYHANIGRFYNMGEPDAAYAEEYYRGNTEVMKEIRKLMKPNLLVNDFFKDVKKLYQDLDLWDKMAFIGGYEIGIAFPPDWCGEFVYDVFFDNKDAVFKPGMVINYETGFGVIDTILFTEEKAEFLSSRPYDLIILGE